MEVNFLPVRIFKYLFYISFYCWSIVDYGLRYKTCQIVAPCLYPLDRPKERDGTLRNH